MAAPKPYFLKFLFSGIFLIALSIYLLRTTYKDKKEFQKITGTVDFISMKYLDLPYRDFTKFRYIKIMEYEKPFEIFVGKDPGDFTPALDKIDSVKRGDILTFYFRKENFETTDPPVNRLAYYIDKGSTPVFIFSPSQFYLALVVLSLSIIIIIISVVGKIKGRII
jgi:hypothetical protein